MDLRSSGVVPQLSGAAVCAESRPSTIGPINLGMKSTGKPSAGNPHAGFDAAGAGNQFTARLVRHPQRKREATARPGLRSMVPVLDPTDERGRETAGCHSVPVQRPSSTLPRSPLFSTEVPAVGANFRKNHHDRRRCPPPENENPLSHVRSAERTQKPFVFNGGPHGRSCVHLRSLAAKWRFSTRYRKNTERTQSHFRTPAKPPNEHP